MRIGGPANPGIPAGFSVLADFRHRLNGGRRGSSLQVPFTLQLSPQSATSALLLLLGWGEALPYPELCEWTEDSF